MTGTSTPARRSVLATALPWTAAALLFAPRRRLAPEDATVGRLGRTRAVTGLAVTVGIAVWFGSYSELGLENFLQSLALTGLLAIPSALLCMALLVAVTMPGRRRAAAWQMRWPVLSLAAFTLVMALLLLFDAGGAQYAIGELKQRGIEIPLDGVVAGGCFGLWFLVFVFRSAYLVSLHWFNAVDGHLLLAPVTATWMSWLLAVNTIVFREGDDELPTLLVVGLPVGGAVVTTGIAAVEAWRAMRVYGATVRGGVPRAHPGPTL